MHCTLCSPGPTACKLTVVTVLVSVRCTIAMRPVIVCAFACCSLVAPGPRERQHEQQQQHELAAVAEARAAAQTYSASSSSIILTFVAPGPSGAEGTKNALAIRVLAGVPACGFEYSRTYIVYKIDAG